MSVDNKVPEIRIKNFSGKWYEVALSSVIDVRSGKDYKHLGKGNIPVYGTGGYMLSVDSALSNDEDAIGIGRKGTIDKPCILRAPFWTVDTLFYAVPLPGFNLDFLFCLFQKIEWKKHNESTGVPSLSKIAINNVPVYATNELEQTAIGNYFQKIDALINQHQQKHDKLNSIKKAMLEKMFPKQGETIPEIRFKGFSGEWEAVQVGDIAKTTIGEFVKQTRQNPNSPYPVFNGGKSFTGHYDDYNNEGDKILVSARGANAGFVNYQKTRFWAGNSCYSIEINEKSEYHTIFVYFSIKRIQHLFTDFQQAANIPSISKGDVEKFKIMIPSFKEQTAIGNYFEKLDNLINQHQQQITKLNNIKQACLSKMFV
ncbi:restriction endonuclease subunit S [Rahnella sp. AA]|uniref:restriction endonuclease subunit S n=1 Tax=Rahnella sp. AA TaxID=2057180 RepID=UPI000C332D83|nr:restriction endonuclease subunit S [Rahnella sp. AA]PKE32543.1 restriction endonuclease subunit S [Rahnella sp. AA]